MMNQPPEGTDRPDTCGEERHRLIEDKLQHRLAMEEMVATISTRFINVPYGECDDAIMKVLGEIAGLLGADGGTLNMLDDTGRAFRKRYLWAAEHVVVSEEVRQEGDFEKFTYMSGRLKKGLCVYIPSRDVLPEDAPVEKEFLKEYGIHSLFHIPVFKENKLFAVVGFHGFKKPISLDDEDIRLLGLVGEIFSNYYLRRDADEKIRLALKEKESMLREIHHRVYNNLQLILSLLNLQARNAKHPEALSFFHQSRDRLKTITLVHEQVYMSDNLAHIDMALFTRAMASHLQTAYGKQGISVSVGGDEVRLDIQAAISCALIVSELLSNALQYAYDPGEMGDVAVVLTKQDKEVFFTVSDGGKGLPAGVSMDSPATFGLQLIKELAGHLDGKIERKDARGTAITLRLPYS
jgi:two-component sensor histidine kinase